MTRYCGGGGGGTKHLFLLTLYNSKILGGGRGARGLLRGPCFCCALYCDVMLGYKIYFSGHAKRAVCLR